MGYRNDHDALLAQADALRRELATRESELREQRRAGADAEGRAVRAEKELARLERKLARLEGRAARARRKSDGKRRPARNAVGAAVGVAGFVACLVMILLIRARPERSVQPVSSPSSIDVSRVSDPSGRMADAAAPDPDVLRRAKLRAYRSALDQVDHALRHLMWTYRGPPEPADERPVYDTWGIHSWFKLRALAETASALRVAGGQAPALAELDAAALAYADALAALEPVLDEALRYHEHKDYLDDGGARGRALDGTLGQLFTRFEAASDGLRARLHEPWQAVLGRDDDTADVVVRQAWAACSAIADHVAAGDAPAGLGPALDRCAGARAALDRARRGWPDPDGPDYLLELLDDIIEYGKALRRGDPDKPLRMYSSLAQVHAYAADRFARLTVP